MSRASLETKQPNPTSQPIIMSILRNAAFSVLFASSILATPSSAKAETTIAPVLNAPSVESVETAEAAMPGAWRSFGSRFAACSFARRMRCRGHFTNVFYYPIMCWWVVQFG